MRFINLYYLFVAFVFAHLLGGGAVASAFGSAPAPGTLIEGQAAVNYVDPIKFVSTDIYSNKVVVRVTGASGIDLRSSQTRTQTAGTVFTFAHTLTNTGNIASTFTVSPALLPGSLIGLEALAMVEDVNADGVIDPGEAHLPLAEHTVTLNPGQSWHFILTGRVPVTLPAAMGQTEDVLFQIVARDLNSGASAVNNDTLTVSRSEVIGSGSLQISKSVSSPVASRGDELTYTITGTNTTALALEGRRVTVNGMVENLFVVHDDIPANIDFIEVLQTNGALPLYRYAGSPRHFYETAFDASRTVATIAWAFPQLPGSGSFEFRFRARVGATASGAIHNTAEGIFKVGSAEFSKETNVSTVTVPTAAATINYFRDDSYSVVAPVTRIGRDLFVEVHAGMCNTRADRIDTITVRIVSEKTGDTESFTAVETGPNTGVFRIAIPVPTMDGKGQGALHGDGALQTLANDKLTAEIVGGCGTGTRIWTEILIDPYGVVYDSRTNQPITGAQVTLVNVMTGQPADVWDESGAPAPSTIITAADGQFSFPLVAPGTYKITVKPPDDYLFPSSIPVGMLPAGRTTLLPGSYGGNFNVNVATGVVVLDVPVDTTSGNGLALKKEASRSSAEIGDSVIYTLTLTNSSGADFHGTYIDDFLPTGFRYEPGTTRRDNANAPDPQGGVGPKLQFNVGTLANGATAVFTYRVRLTPGAEKGDGINSAQATSLGPPVLKSNIAYAQVKPLPGIFDPRGVLIGTVFVDANDNGVQDPGEPGVPGVRLILEDGTYVITDAQGKYSLYGLKPLTHVIKVDPYTLPSGAKLGGKSPRFALDPNSRFVDMKNYELHKANFMLVEPTPELYEAIKERKKQAEQWAPEFARALDYTFNADGNRQLPTDIESREAAGVVGGQQALPGPFESVLPEGTLTSGNSSLPAAPNFPVPIINLEDRVKGITDVKPQFIGLKDGDTLPYAIETVRIAGPDQMRLELLINGEPAPKERIGKIIQQPEPPLQAMEYVALNFRPGANTLELVAYDLFGNERGRETITIIAPDRMANIQLSFSSITPVADGMTPVIVDVQVVDKNGTPVTADMQLTLESSRGRWEVEDQDKVTPGVQVFLKGGRGSYRLLPPIEPGASKVVVSSGALKSEQRIDFMPELRPMIATGIIEGRVSLNRLSANQLLPITPDDAFEESLREMAGIGPDGQLGGRAAFYLKGKISGKTLLTIAYDSQKKRGQTELFRDIDPDAFYPVYGDDSVKGYDAQSSSNLYVRIDYERSFALLGDFNTRADNEARQLGDYNRSFNGVRLHYEESWVSSDFWITDDSSTQVINDFPANGTSGPFFLNSGGNIILNSETVEIITRDRNQPSVILDTRTLTRYTDYDFEPFSGRLLLNRPVASMDANFNPQFIRVTYELEHTSGKRFLTYGGSAQIKPLDWLEVGGSFVRDENPSAHYDLQSVNGTIRLADNTFLIAEGARSDSMIEGIGYAGRFDLRHQSEDTQARIFYGITDTNFDNPSSTLNAGRIEGGMKVTHNLTEATQLIAEGVYTEDKASTGNRKGVRLDAAHTFDNQVKVTVGGRVSEESAASADPSLPGGGPLKVRSLRLRVDTPVPEVPMLSVFGEYEQDIFEADQRVVAAGGHYQINTGTRLYARHEFISSLGSPFELENGIANHNTLIGLESEYMENGYITNEYRVRNAIDGRQAEAAMGVRNLWNVSDGLAFNTTFERVTPFGSTTSNRSTAATLGFEYTRPTNWKATGRVEGRWADTNDNYLNTLGYAHKVDQQWTFLTRSIFNTQLAKGGGGSGSGGGSGTGASASNMYQGRFLVGMAFRQAEIDEWNALFRYEYKYEQGSANLGTNAAGLQRQVHVLGTSVNYQPDANWIFSGHYATKLVFESGGGYNSSSYIAHIAAGRVIYEITERWDVGLSLAATFSDKIENIQYAVGPEIGYIINKNVRIGVGYNIVGFNDRDFDTAATSQGVFLSLRIKFDESLLDWARFD